ncbi:MAG: mechanosensitive ion channel domain-containing protein [Patescibacteria group bacterium]
MKEEVINWLLTSGIRLLIIIFFGVILYYLFKRFGENWIRKITQKRYEIRDGESIAKRTRTLYDLLVGTLKILIIFAVIFLTLDELGVNIAPLLTGAGIIGVAIGFGSQALVKAYISGIFILLEDQFRIGDMVRINNIEGMVEDFTLRKTALRDKNDNLHYIPNDQITIVSNLSKGKEILKSKSPR